MISEAKQNAAETRPTIGGANQAPANAPGLLRDKGGATPSEIELRLSGKASQLRAAFAKLDGRAHGTQNVLGTYYDTPDGYIWHRGFSLSLRENRDNHELTLKEKDRGRLEYGRWTSFMAKPLVDIGSLPQNAPRSKLGVILPEELEPRFTSDIQRKRKTIKTGEAVLRVSLDEGSIVAAKHRLQIAELKFALSSGPVADLLKCVGSTLHGNELSISPQSKASRGMGMLNGAPPETVKASKPYLDPSNTISQTVAKVLKVTATQIMGNLAAAVDGRDPEGVHQLRVSLRRLRSALLIFKKHLGPMSRDLDGETKRSLKQLGDARDLDVFLTETLAPVIAGSCDEPGLVNLGGIAEKRRADAYGGVRQLVTDRQFNRFLLDLLTVAEGGKLVVKNADVSLIPMAQRTLTRRHKKVMVAGNDFERLSEEQRHEVRIELKKLRYACDFFQTVFPGDATRAYLRRLADLQEHLGRLNDAAVAAQLTRELAAGDTAASIGAALVRGWHAHGLRAVEPQVLGAWRKFVRARPFWRPLSSRDR